jgi:flagellar motor switch protein FliG
MTEEANLTVPTEVIEEPSRRGRGPITTRRKNEEMNPSEKAAVLLIALGVATSAAVLKHLPEEEVERLSIELAKLKFRR